MCRWTSRGCGSFLIKLLIHIVIPQRRLVWIFVHGVTEGPELARRKFEVQFELQHRLSSSATVLPYCTVILQSIYLGFKCGQSKIHLFRIRVHPLSVRKCTEWCCARLGAILYSFISYAAVYSTRRSQESRMADPASTV